MKSKKQNIVSEFKSNPALYRCKLNCKIGKDALDDATKLPPNCDAGEYALYCLLNAVDDMATALMKRAKTIERERI